MNMVNEKFGPERDAGESLSEKLRGFVVKLSDEADRRVKARSSIENRWLEDLAQYHGRYDRRVWERLTEKKKSRVFLNLTRAKTNAMMARLWDLLFPTDDRNWGIQPTPVPELNDEIEAQLSLIEDAQETFADRETKLRAAEEREDEDEAQALAAEMDGIEKVETEARKAADELSEIVREAARRCDLMEKEIEDQLIECFYQSEARLMIRDACKVGTGVIKGPVAGERVRRRWVKKQAGGVVTDLDDGSDDAKTVYEIEQQTDDRPAAEWVDFWSYFPSPDSTCPEESEGVYERHLMKPHMLRKLARRPDIDEDAVRDLLQKGPNTEAAPSYLVDLRELSEQNEVATENLFHVWEFTGALVAEDLALLYEAGVDDRIGDVIADVDPLDEVHVRVWFCQDRLLSFALHPLDSNESLYSVFNLQEDESSQFGFGIPYLMRDEQTALNASKRMMMDNSGMTTGPQVFMNKKLIEPANGSWEIEPMKIWLMKDVEQAETNVPPIQMFNIDGHQGELANLIELNRRDIDEVTSLPQIAQGEQGVGVTKTAQGMALLMNSANVGFRMFVKNFDDNVTVPLINRFYHWNMQFSDKEEIKGDYNVDARGSSVLLVREMQANNLMMIMTGLGDHPKYGAWLKDESLLKELFRAHNLSAQEHIKTQREMEKDTARMAEQPDPMLEIERARLELEREKLAAAREEIELKAAAENQQWAARQRIAELEYARAMQIDVAKINADLDKAEMNVESSERKLATEVGMKMQTGDSAGGSV